SVHASRTSRAVDQGWMETGLLTCHRNDVRQDSPPRHEADDALWTAVPAPPRQPDLLLASPLPASHSIGFPMSSIFRHVTPSSPQRARAESMHRMGRVNRARNIRYTADTGCTLRNFQKTAGKQRGNRQRLDIADAARGY